MKRPPNACKFWADTRARDVGILTSLVGRVFHTIVACRRRVNFKAKRAYLNRSKYGLYPSCEVDQIMLKFRTISLILDFRVPDQKPNECTRPLNSAPPSRSSPSLKFSGFAFPPHRWPPPFHAGAIIEGKPGRHRPSPSRVGGKRTSSLRSGCAPSAASTPAAHSKFASSSLGRWV